MMSEAESRSAQVASFLATERVLCGEFPGIVFVGNKPTGRLLARDLRAAVGVDVPFVTAATPRRRREQLLEQLRAKDPSVPVVVATTVWATGIDIPQLCWAALTDERGTAPIGIVQAAGRPRRVGADKTSCEIINVAYTGRAVKVRNGHLAAAGFEVSEEDFISQLGEPATPVADTGLQELPGPTLADHVFNVIVCASGLLLLASIIQTC